MNHERLAQWLISALLIFAPLQSMAWGRLGHEVMASMSNEQ
jgi:hypothetical protein